MNIYFQCNFLEVKIWKYHLEKLSVKKILFFYTLGTEKGSSGSPIILIENSKIIGLHKAGYIKK